jgi:hypothetical protein
MRPLAALAPLLVASLAYAQDAPAFDPNAAPPSMADQKAILLAPHSINHVHGYPVDETCFGDDVIMKKAWPAGMGRGGLTIGEVTTSNLDLSGPHPASFAEFKKFVDELAVKGKKMLYGLNLFGHKNLGYKAWCVDDEPLLRGGDVARITNKVDPTIDQKSYRIGITPAGLDKVRTLPKTVYRIAFVYDDALVLGAASVDDELRGMHEIAVFEAVDFTVKEEPKAKKKKRK